MMIQIPIYIPIALAVYLAVFVLIQILTHLGLKGERTAHGQIVGRQIGCIFGLFWPISVPLLLVILVWLGLRWTVRRLRGKKS